MLLPRSRSFRAYVHLGYPKCGSTSIQSLLARRKKVFYLGKGAVERSSDAPSIAGRAPVGHDRFVDDRIGWVIRREIPAIPDISYDAGLVATALRGAVAEAKARRMSSLHLSDEVLSGVGLSLYGSHREPIGTIARRLAEGFDVPVTFLVVPRSQPAFLWSYYRQLLRRGYPLSFEGFLEDQCRVPTHDEDGARGATGIAAHLSYDRMVDAVGPHGELVVVPFEEMVADQTGLDRAMTALGLPAGLSLPHRNQGIEDPEQSVRDNAAKLRGAGRRVPAGMFERDQERRRRHEAAGTSPDWRDCISDDLMAFFAAGNARFAERTGMDLARFGYPLPR